MYDCKRKDCLNYERCLSEHHRTSMNNCMSHGYSDYENVKDAEEETLINFGVFLTGKDRETILEILNEFNDPQRN